MVQRLPDIARWSIALLLIALLAAAIWHTQRQHQRNPIRIGVLHSLTGTMVISERPLVDAVRMAVEELNASGGVLGRPVEMVVVDGRSDPASFARGAEQLLAREGVKALFGCWTSASRKAVIPVVEKHAGLMFYPVQYEGMEQSPNLIYLGSAPNQQIVPGARWAMQQFGKRVYLLGSDYVFPRTANLLIHDLVRASGGTVVGEQYLPLGSTDVDAVLADIARQQPDVLLNTVNGDSNAAVFAGLLRHGLGAIPVLSYSVTENEMRALGGEKLGRHYGVWSYFSSTPDARNRAFVSRFKARFGPDHSTSDPVEAAYVGVHLWAQAVAMVGSAEPARVNGPTLLRQSLNGPSSIVSIEPANRHAWKMVRIGRVTPDGEFEQVFSSISPLRPSPWPRHRSRAEWQDRLAMQQLDPTP
ncbi:urea ABC transporter substrate-binding protein [Chitinimonas sp. BJYL2]|uniref:urea ABC transporter substrate-binding protein n=1 Tax=Chitinimonas sp. BJYL2 TaxID=2976696 RepID=UPI0022B3E128|nr:urea ABC transporter substrate-binding protein [Chitinimonas sp. BJYL2]